MRWSLAIHKWVTSGQEEAHNQKGGRQLPLALQCWNLWVIGFFKSTSSTLNPEFYFVSPSLSWISLNMLCCLLGPCIFLSSRPPLWGNIALNGDQILHYFQLNALFLVIMMTLNHKQGQAKNHLQDHVSKQLLACRVVALEINLNMPIECMFSFFFTSKSK